MKTLLCCLFVMLLCYQSNAQNTKNLDFEILENNKAKDWLLMGNDTYKATLDSVEIKTGKYSGVLISDEQGSGFRAWAYKIPATFKSGKIKLTGYIKTENVSNGHAGLWMRLDPKLGFNNMANKGVIGTTDWKKHEIELELTNQVEGIVVGGILVGKGKMWVDNLKVTIDGVPLEKVEPKVLSKVDKDQEFNQGSAVTIPELNETNLNNLVLLGRIWGFLKYYHPEIAAGNFNWDYELFRILPHYLKTENNKQRDALLLNWIDKLGEIADCKKCKALQKDAYITPDLDWLNNNNLSKMLRKRLNHIKNNRFTGAHYYVKPFKTGNPDFTNEKLYTNITHSDEGFKLLSVYRYWNMIQYYFPYKNETDQNWNTVLKEMITRVLQTKTETEYHLALLEMVVKIDDSHGYFYSAKTREYFGNKSVPFSYKIINDKIIITELLDEDLAKTDDIKIGDAIKVINGNTVSEILINNAKYIYASNASVKKRNSKNLIFKGNEDTINIVFERDGKTTSKNIKKHSYNAINFSVKDDQKWKILEGNIGYINMGILKPEDVDNVIDTLKATKGIVFDIRNYPNGTLYKLAEYLNPKSIEFVKFTKQDFSYPGTFLWTEPYKTGHGNKTKLYKGKIVIIVNEITQSHAEFTTMCLQTAQGALIIGSQTSGADGNVSKIPFIGGFGSMITGIGVYYPDGTKTQRIGIIPDIEVLPTIKGIRAGIDEPLEKAIEVINSK